WCASRAWPIERVALAGRHATPPNAVTGLTDAHSEVVEREWAGRQYCLVPDFFGPLQLVAPLMHEPAEAEGARRGGDGSGSAHAHETIDHGRPRLDQFRTKRHPSQRVGDEGPALGERRE